MNVAEIFAGFKVFTARVKITQPYPVYTDVSVFARDINMARQQLKQQYGAKSLVSGIRELK